MSEAVEGGAGLAWRLLATLEGGSLLLATSALLAYTVRSKLVGNRSRRSIRSVLVTNTTNLLGRELKSRLEAQGIVVSDATSGAAEKVDALVVIGAEPKEDGLNGVADLVTEDVYANLKIRIIQQLLESLSGRVRRGGCMAWACARAGPGAGAGAGAFAETSAAFDTMLHASLQHVAKVSHCEPIWVGRCDGAEQVAERVVAALMSCANAHNASRFSVR